MVKKTEMPHKAVKKAAVSEAKPERYFEAIGRRKTAIARVRIYPTMKNQGTNIIVNEKPFNKYFPLERERKTVVAAFTLTDTNYHSTVLVKGGGLNAQAEAIRMGFARVLTILKEELRPKLKAYGFLKRDPRMVERKK